MTLHITRTGHGPRVVLLHGWALNSHVWDTLKLRLDDRYTVDCVDLPGHGDTPWGRGLQDLRSLAATLLPALDDECVLLGWSLGALAALQLALDDNKFRLLE